MNSIKDELAKTAAVGLAKKLDQVILEHLPHGAVLAGVSRIMHHPSNVETWHYNGEPFLEVHPIEFSTEIRDDSSTVFKSSFKYRAINARTRPPQS